MWSSTSTLHKLHCSLVPHRSFVHSIFHGELMTAALVEEQENGTVDEESRGLVFVVP